MSEPSQNHLNVAIEVADGDAVGTTEIAREKHLKISTIFRWISKGLPRADGSRVRLEAVRRGRTWLTSRAAMRRFFAALPSNMVEGDPQTCRSEKNRSHSACQRAADEAKAALKNRFDI